MDCKYDFRLQKTGRYTALIPTLYVCVTTYRFSYSNIAFRFSDGISHDVQFTISTDYLESIIMLAVPFGVAAVLVLISGIGAMCCLGFGCGRRMKYSATKLSLISLTRAFFTFLVG